MYNFFYIFIICTFLQSCNDCENLACEPCPPLTANISFSCGDINTQQLDTFIVYRTLLENGKQDTLAFYPDFNLFWNQVTYDTIFRFTDENLQGSEVTRFQLYSYILRNPALKQAISIKNIKVNSWEESGCCGCQRVELIEATINDTLVYRNGAFAIKLE